MLKIKILIFLSLIKNSFSPCAKDRTEYDFSTPAPSYSIHKTGRLPAVVDESSGLVMLSDSTFWTINDSGNPLLYEVDLKGNLISTTVIPNSSIIDWEEITRDKNGFVYLGDFGNNANRRQNLRIYKYDPAGKTTDTISFSYLDQPAFPPEKEFKNFDCEAMFHFNDSLYLVSKNRGNKTVRFYKLSDKPGNYSIQPFFTAEISSMITGATIDAEQKKIVLMSYGKFYSFTLDTANKTLFNPCSCVGFARNAQAEGVSFLKNNSLLITNEQGKIFLARPKK